MTVEQMIARQQEILNAANAAGRELTAEERAEFDGLQRNIDAAKAAGSAHGGQNANKPSNGGAQRSGEEGEEPDPAGTAQRAAEEERTRIRSIENLCRSFGIEADTYIQNGSTMDQVRAAILDTLEKRNAPVNGHVTVTDDAGDRFRRQASDALLLKSGMSIEKPEDGARSMVGMSLRDLAIECLRMDGQETGGLNRRSSDEIFTLVQRSFFNPEAAFPAILDNTIEKAYKETYNHVQTTFDKWTKKGSLKDFKIHDNYYVAGPVGEFEEVPENGELKHDVFGDAKLPKRQLKTYGKQFTLSRKAFIDDDIGLITSIPSRYAASAKKTINKKVYEILINNANTYDGLPLFGTKHKNLLATGTGVTQEAMQTMIMALANQTDQFGEAIIINPATIVVPSGMKFDMYTLFFSPTINTTDNTQAVNPLYQYRDQIQVVEDPTINVLCGGLGKTMPWFLIGDSTDCEFIEVDYLNGQEIPTIRRMETAGQLGFTWDIFLDWGISVMDYRGAVKNPAVTVATNLTLA